MSLPHRQSGLTMVELMVALTLSLLLLAGVLQVYLSSKQTQRLDEGLARLQENGRLAIEFLARHIRMAGETATPPWAFTDPALEGADGGGSSSDRVTVRYQAAKDCTGAIPTAQPAVNTFFIDANLNLACTGNGTEPLVEGVENLQVLYGEDTDGDGTANRYVAAGAVSNMANVLSVRIAILVRTPDEVGSSLDTSTYNLLGTIIDPPDDRRLHRVFTATVRLRNRGA